jgi:hypothetical protein
MVTEHAALSPAMNQLLALFASDLAQVRFGNLDGDTLEAAAMEVDHAAAALAKAEAAAATARAALETAQALLLQKAQRALAHARIHAEGDPALTERLQTITLDDARMAERDAASAPVVTAPVRRRGRPPRSAGEATGTLLLEDAAAAPSGATASDDLASARA